MQTVQRGRTILARTCDTGAEERSLTVVCARVFFACSLLVIPGVRCNNLQLRTAMAALSGGEMCVKFMMFAFNLLFWVSLN